MENKYSHFTIEEYIKIADMVNKYYELLKEEITYMKNEIKNNLTEAKNNKKELSLEINNKYNIIYNKIIASKKGIDILIRDVENFNVNIDKSKKEEVLKKYEEEIRKLYELTKYVNENIRPQSLLEQLQIYFLENNLTELGDIRANEALYARISEKGYKKIYI